MLKKDTDFKAFGRRKTIIIQAIIDGQDRSFHENILINNQTTFKKYWEVVKDLITKNYEDGYPLEVINQFKVRVWNMNNISNKKIKLTKNAMYIRSKASKKFLKVKGIIKAKKAKKDLGKRGYSTLIQQNNVCPEFCDNLECVKICSKCLKKLNKTHITPLKHPKSLVLNRFMTLDIETMNINGLQIPVVVTTYYDENPKIFIVDKELLLSDQEKAVNKLFKEVFDYINEQKIRFIFVHNLGKFVVLDRDRSCLFSIKR